MTQPRSNSRRFVSAAWSLLTFQLIASAGAVAVTGYAAFHVGDLLRSAQQMDRTIETAAPATEAPMEATGEAPTETTAPVPAPAVPINEGSGTLVLRADERGNIIASLSDPDGVSMHPQMQWYRNGQPVQGATGEIYSVRYEDSQATIVARAEYVDDHGFNETVTSDRYQVGVIIP